MERPGGHPNIGHPHIVLIGLMGAGKSTLAEALADRLGHPIRDSDRDIEVVLRFTGADLAEHHGVPRLHGVERGMLLGALASDEPTIITAAASTVEDELCRQAMRQRAFVVVLQAPVEVLLERAAAGVHRRPVDPDEFAALAARRAGPFAEVADLTVDARLPVEDLVTAVVEAAGRVNDPTGRPGPGGSDFGADLDHRYLPPTWR
ncbi:MAG: AAA family ATPase [Acidimicrobiia bacterium]|nr:AAA family ATPase [Acidimicrobiia bacterium]